MCTITGSGAAFLLYYVNWKDVWLLQCMHVLVLKFGSLLPTLTCFIMPARSTYKHFWTIIAPVQLAWQLAMWWISATYNAASRLFFLDAIINNTPMKPANMMKTNTSADTAEIVITTCNWIEVHRLLYTVLFIQINLCWLIPTYHHWFPWDQQWEQG